MISTDSPLDVLIAGVAFLVAIGVLVSVHEFGHFWVARKLGIRVLRFSIGFGKPLWRRIGGKDQVEYVVAAVPLGGYVKLLDEREGNVDPAEAPRAFNRQPVWKRIAVLLAGPTFNLLFAILLYWILFMVGVPAPKPIIGAAPIASTAESHPAPFPYRLPAAAPAITAASTPAATVTTRPIRYSSSRSAPIHLPSRPTDQK